MLLTCDLNRGRNSIVSMEMPQIRIDEVPDKPFGWDPGDITHEETGTVLKWPKTYKMGYFDGVRMVFLVFFTSSTVGCFFANGDTELFHRVSFYDRFCKEF